MDVPINIGMTQLALAHPSADGTFSVSLTIPAATPAGELEIDAIIGNGDSASARFTVTGGGAPFGQPHTNPTVTLTPAEGPPGTVTTAEGHGFTPNQPVAVTQSGGPGITGGGGTIQADQSGSIKMTFRIADQTPLGFVTVTFTQGANTPTAQFQVTASQPGQGNSGQSSGSQNNTGGQGGSAQPGQGSTGGPGQTTQPQPGQPSNPNQGGNPNTETPNQEGNSGQQGPAQANPSQANPNLGNPSNQGGTEQGPAGSGIPFYGGSGPGGRGSQPQPTSLGNPVDWFNNTPVFRLLTSPKTSECIGEFVPGVSAWKDTLNNQIPLGDIVGVGLDLIGVGEPFTIAYDVAGATKRCADDIYHNGTPVTPKHTQHDDGFLRKVIKETAGLAHAGIALFQKLF